VSHWRYDSIPSGIRFRFQEPKGREPADVMVVAGFNGGKAVGSLLESEKEAA
jgi:hypothetical protein